MSKIFLTVAAEAIAFAGFAKTNCINSTHVHKEYKTQLITIEGRTGSI